MDEMKLKLSNGLLKSIVAKMVSKLVCERLGYSINVELNEIGISRDTNGKVAIHLNPDRLPL